jgi:hypothetical protein
MDAIKILLENYEIEDPIVSNEIWVFSNEKLQTLYNELLEKGEKSLADWIQVGIDIEKLDINDLETLLINIEDWTDIEKIYSNLLKWSQNHLTAFQRQL